MGGKGGAKQQVTKYYMPLMYGVCHAGVDAVTGLFYGQKLAWSGDVTSNSGVQVNAPNLFGGLKKEGGLQGNMHVQLGGDNQVVHNDVINSIGGSANETPEYRGILSILFAGRFYWSATTPYLKDIWIRAKRKPKGDAGTLPHAVISNDPYTVNPAAIIYEILNNDEWGLAQDSTLIDFDGFKNCANTLYTDGIGLALMWDSQSSAADMINSICDTISGLWFVSPKTGKHTLKLIRDDYTVANLDIIDASNAKLQKFERGSWEGTTNEVVMGWTNPQNEMNETVSVQDIGNIARQGVIVSKSIDYDGIRTANLALQLANRELRSLSTPFATASVKVQRMFALKEPGDVVILRWPRYTADDGIVMRIVSIDYGRPGDSWLKIDLAEDIFSRSKPHTFTPPQPPPAPDYSPAAVTHNYAQTINPYLIMASGIGLDQMQYPQVAAVSLVSSDKNYAYGYDLQKQVTDANNQTSYVSVGQRSFACYATLDNALSQEATTVVAETDVTITSARQLSLGDLVWIGADKAEDEQELAYVSDVDASGYHLRRGVLDTTPKAWPANTIIMAINPQAEYADQDVSVGESPKYKALMLTPQGQYAESSASSYTATMSERPYLPYPPANVKVNGTRYGTATGITTSSVAVSWSRRNRKTEDTIILGWEDGDVTPEDNQTVYIRVQDAANSVDETYGPFSGTSTTLDISGTAFASGTFSLFSRRMDFDVDLGDVDTIDGGDIDNPGSGGQETEFDSLESYVIGVSV